MPGLTVAVTGANGYVGRIVAAAVTGGGNEVVGLSSSPGPGQRGYRLGEPVPPPTLAGIDAVVHAAHDFSAPPAATHERNTAGSRPLLEAAADAGVPVVLITTLSAFDGCRSAYGRAKVALEHLVFEQGGRVLRAGLVTGPGAGGIVGALDRWVGRAPVVPVFAAHSATYVTDADALGRLVRHLATGADAAGTARPILAAADDCLSFVAVVRALAAARGRTVRALPVPVPLGLAALRAAEALGVPVPFRSDSLVALAHPIPADQVAQLEPSPVAFPPAWLVLAGAGAPVTVNPGSEAGRR